MDVGHTPSSNERTSHMARALPFLIGGALLLCSLGVLFGEYSYLTRSEPPPLSLAGYHWVLAIVSPLMSVLLAVCVLLRKGRQWYLFLTLMALLWLVPIEGFALLDTARERAWSAAFHRVTQAGTPLVKAIGQYQAAHNGTPPSSLDALVPTYLAAIPGTGVRAFPEFRYQQREGQWSLFVPCPRAPLDFSYFRYVTPGWEEVLSNPELHGRHGNWVYICD